MKLRLVPPELEFAERLFQWRNEAASKRHNPLVPMSLEDCRKNILTPGSDLKDLWSKPSFRIFVEVDGEIAGNISLNSLNKMMLTAEIGYTFGEKFHGRGVGTAAVRAMAIKVFTETDLRKLIAMVNDKNAPSCKLLEKIGFKREGLLREHYLINGKPENEVIYGLLRSDLESVKPLE